jgi:hypothetical protein
MIHHDGASWTIKSASRLPKPPTIAALHVVHTAPDHSGGYLMSSLIAILQDSPVGPYLQFGLQNNAAELLSRNYLSLFSSSFRLLKALIGEY